MAYARFSSDDCRSDVYVYESVHGGFVTHVATKRLELSEPLPEPVQLLPLPEADPSVTQEQWDRRADEYLARHRHVQQVVSRSELAPIGLPHDGETFVHATAAESADHLERLRALGYHVPEFAIRALREEDSDDLEGAR